jgi:hypothetical protein
MSQASFNTDEAVQRNGGRQRPLSTWSVALLALVALGGLGLAGADSQPKGASAPASADEALPEPSQDRLVGVGSCTAAGCHGNAASRTRLGRAYNIWVGQDPHARAYSALFDKRSLRMVRLLNNLPEDAHVEPNKDKRCLVCHSMTHAEARDNFSDVLSDGVGCEACHGPAERWVADHYQRKLNSAQRKALHMTETKDLLTRTQLCVGCHVGAPAENGWPARDVNHDLIAAGHPRLQFEMTAYMEAMPKHWDTTALEVPAGVASEPPIESRPDFAARTWAVGQVCASQAAMQQLADRAKKNNTWPEFSEWECSACHHDLSDDTVRQSSLAAAGGLSGQLIEWDTWNHFMSREHAAALSGAFGNDVNAAEQIQNTMRQLIEEMRKLYPDRTAVAELAQQNADRLRQWAGAIAKSQVTVPGVDEITKAILDAKRESKPADWPSAAQTYDALASLHDTRTKLEPGASANEPLTVGIQALFEDLSKKQTPAGYFILDREAVAARLNELQSLFNAREPNR